MEEENKPITLPEERPKTKSWKSQLITITTFSKYLALVLFVALPFIGFYFGMQVSVNDTNDTTNNMVDIKIEPEPSSFSDDTKLPSVKLYVSPETIPFQQYTDVTFTAQLHMGFDFDTPAAIADDIAVYIEEIDSKKQVIRRIGFLNPVRFSGPPKGGTVQETFSVWQGYANKSAKYRAVAVAVPNGKIKAYSNTVYIDVTEFPQVPAIIDEKLLVEDVLNPRITFPSNEVHLFFNERTPVEEVRRIVEAENAEVLNSRLHGRRDQYEVRILGNGEASGVYAAIRAFEAYPEIWWATPHTISAPSADPPTWVLPPN